MKLGGHMGHGPNSSYNHLWENMSCCHGIMTENDTKNGQMNVRIVKSMEEMGKIHSYQDTCVPALNIFLYEIFRWPLTWPRYRSKVRKRLNPTSSLGLKKTWWYWVERVSMSRPKTGSIRLAMWPIVARSRDLKLFCQVTLNWETRIPPVSMYIQAGFGPPGLESRFQSLFHDFTFLPVTYVTIRSRVFKRLYLLNGDT